MNLRTLNGAMLEAQRFLRTAEALKAKELMNSIEERGYED
jgi:hypothetical protein